MEKQNKVSLWVGNLETKTELEKFMLEKYDDEGDSSSDFMKAFKIDYVDNQFQEVFFYENMNTKQDIFEGFSYVVSYLEEIPDLNWENYNSIILLYNFKYNKVVLEKESLTYIGSFDFIED